MQEKKIAFILPGLFGSPQDFSFCQKEFPFLQTISLSDPRFWHKTVSLEEWGRNFASYVEEKKAKKNILLGYSLGGRLALHVWEQNPTLFEKVILISTHPGLESEKEKKERQKKDLLWKEMYLTLSEKDFWEKWNNREVFGGFPFFSSKRQDWKVVSHHFDFFSLSRQKSFYSLIQRSKTLFFWIVGEKDQKFLSIADKMVSLHPFSQRIQIPGSFHRPFLEKPNVFLKELKKIFENAE